MAKKKRKKKLIDIPLNIAGQQFLDDCLIQANHIKFKTQTVAITWTTPLIISIINEPITIKPNETCTLW